MFSIFFSFFNFQEYELFAVNKHNCLCVEYVHRSVNHSLSNQSFFFPVNERWGVKNRVQFRAYNRSLRNQIQNEIDRRNRNEEWRAKSGERGRRGKKIHSTEWKQQINKNIGSFFLYFVCFRHHFKCISSFYFSPLTTVSTQFPFKMMHSCQKRFTNWTAIIAMRGGTREWEFYSFKCICANEYIGTNSIFCTLDSCVHVNWERITSAQNKNDFFSGTLMDANKYRSQRMTARSLEAKDERQEAIIFV